MGWDKSVVTAPYGELWKRYRRIAAQSLRKEAVPQFYPGQEREIARFLGSLLTRPEQFVEIFRLCVSRWLQSSMCPHIKN